MPPAIVSFETAALVHFGKRPASDTDDREIDQRAGAEIDCLVLATDRLSKEVSAVAGAFRCSDQRDDVEFFR